MRAWGGAMKEIVLASSSPYRRRLLRRLGIPFRWARPRFEETDPGERESAFVYTRRMALEKARSLARRFPGALILGSDQVAVCEGRILRKPGTEERAVRQLLWLAGREHRLVTAVALVEADSGQEWWQVVSNRMRIRALTRAEARSYVSRDKPLDCAGAYKTESLGIALFEYLRGDDPTAMEGLPLTVVVRLLREAGVRVLG
jgi:septum formation protein